MLDNRVRECFYHAEECMHQAAAQTDAKLRRDYLIIGSCWLKLIREITELPVNFSKPKRQDQVTASLKEGMGEATSLAF
jgi:hypothetical protein